MKIYEITDEFTLKEIEATGTDPLAFDIFSKKSRIIPLKIEDVPSPASVILKQEMLNLGGDAAIHKKAITCGVERSSVVLLGTLEDYEKLVEVLRFMPYFELDKVREKLQVILRRYHSKPSPRVLRSPWGREIVLDSTKIVAIINLTPDSFYAPSRVREIEEGLRKVREAIENGASVIDIGGVSTRPGSYPPPPDEELKRVIPFLREVRKNFKDVMVSIDTFRKEVAERALEEGADIVNDISGFQFDEEMLSFIALNNVPVIINHIKGEPATMQISPSYDHLISEIIDYFNERIEALLNRNYRSIPILDPGIGFGKRYSDNLEIIHRIKEFKSLGYPIMIGHSRKSFIGYFLSEENPLPPESRLEGTLGITAICTFLGVDFIRVHDVKENHMVVKIISHLREVAHEST